MQWLLSGWCVAAVSWRARCGPRQDLEQSLLRTFYVSVPVKMLEWIRKGHNIYVTEKDTPA